MIVRATPDHFQALSRLVAASVVDEAAAAPELFPGLWMGDVVDQISGALGWFSAGAEVWLAMDGAEAVGFAVLVPGRLVGPGTGRAVTVRCWMPKERRGTPLAVGLIRVVYQHLRRSVPPVDVQIAVSPGNDARGLVARFETLATVYGVRYGLESSQKGHQAGQEVHRERGL